MEVISSGTNKCYIECSCGTELVQVTSEFEVKKTNPEFVKDGIIVDQSYNLAFYSFGHTRKMSLWFRIKYAWKILMTGEPYSDMIIMKPEEASKLANFIWVNMVATESTSTE